MSDQDLAAELARLDKAATPGPWTAHEGLPETDPLTPQFTEEGDLLITYEPTWEPDAAFICWLRNHTEEIKSALVSQPGYVKKIMKLQLEAQELTARAVAVEAHAKWLQTENGRLSRALATNEDQGERLREALEETTADRNRLRVKLKHVAKFADDEARPFPDGVRDREGEAVADRLRAILNGGSDE